MLFVLFSMTRYMPPLIKIARLFLPLFSLLLVGCVANRPEGIMQVATIDALLAGVYDGHMTLGQLRKHGDFGLGTFDRLDGEMILLNGTFYKVQGNGNVSRPAHSETTPFAAVTWFSPGRRIDIPSRVDGKGLEKLIDHLVPDQNLFCAFRVEGTFKSLRVRSVPAQTKPYMPLAEVTKNQSVFDFVNVKGTLVGFRSPAFVKGINVPGYHIHFLSANRIQGGHVLALALEEGTLEVDSKIEWLRVFLPSESRDFAKANLSRDRSRELQSVEQE